MHYFTEMHKLDIWYGETTVFWLYSTFSLNIKSLNLILYGVVIVTDTAL
jgi:hypothetical protein